MSAFNTPIDLDSPTGAKLRLRHCAPHEKPRAVIQINHGLAEHAARYARFADVLAGNGFAVLAHDHRGHGGTRAPDAATGIFGKAAPGRAWPAVIEDVRAVHDHAAELYPDIPIIVFGHSLGGVIAMNFALSYPDRPAALSVWNANFKPGAAGRTAQVVLAIERAMLGSDVASRILPKATFAAWGRAIADSRTPFDWLSHDEEQVRAYIDDPHCGWDPSVGLWQDVFAMSYRGADRSALARLPKDMPILLVGGGQDPATDYGRAVSWYGKRLRHLGFRQTTELSYEYMRHETLNESTPDAETAMEDFSIWAEQSIDTDSGPS